MVFKTCLAPVCLLEYPHTYVYYVLLITSMQRQSKIFTWNECFITHDAQTSFYSYLSPNTLLSTVIIRLHVYMYNISIHTHVHSYTYYKNSPFRTTGPLLGVVIIIVAGAPKHCVLSPALIVIL